MPRRRSSRGRPRSVRRPMFWHENSLEVATLTAGTIGFGDMMAGILDRDSLRNPTVVRVIASLQVVFPGTNGNYQFGVRIWAATEQFLLAGAIPTTGASINSYLRQTFNHQRESAETNTFQKEYDLRTARNVKGPERTLALAFYAEAGNPASISRMVLNFRLLIAYG